MCNVTNCVCKVVYLGASLQSLPHLLFGHTEAENIMVLVEALHEACGAQQGHVTGAEVLKGTQVDLTALHLQLLHGLHHGVAPERLLFVVSLKVPRAQRNLALHTGPHSLAFLIDAVVAKNLHPLRDLRRASWGRVHQVTLDDAAEFEVFL